MHKRVNFRNGKRLEEDSKLLGQEIQRQTEDGKNNLSENGDDNVDIGSKIRLKNLSFCLAEMEKKDQIEVKRALKKIEEGTYGDCDQCGGKIQDGRLEARPQSINCISCSKKAKN